MDERPAWTAVNDNIVIAEGNNAVQMMRKLHEYMNTYDTNMRGNIVFLYKLQPVSTMNRKELTGQ